MQMDFGNHDELARESIECLRVPAVDSAEWLAAVDSLKKRGLYVIPLLIQAWGDENLAVRVGVSRVLRGIGRVAVFDIIDALSHQNAAVREEAATFLSGQEEPLHIEVIPGLIQALKDKESTVRIRAAQALLRLGPNAEAATFALIDALDDSEGYVRQWVAAALGAIGEAAKAAVPRLTAALLDEDRDTREEASRALDRILGPGNSR